MSIVSDKIHTTRANTLGYLTDVRYRTQVELSTRPARSADGGDAAPRDVDAVRGTELALVVVDAAAGHRALDRPMRRSSAGWRASSTSRRRPAARGRRRRSC